jgi:hypothetical protein
LQHSNFILEQHCRKPSQIRVCQTRATDAQMK